jgi:hypothetical protein
MDGVLNGSSCSDLGLDGLFLGIFVLRSEHRVENAETDIDVNLGGSSIPRKAAGLGSRVGFWDRTRESRGVPLSGRWNGFDRGGIFQAIDRRVRAQNPFSNKKAEDWSSGGYLLSDGDSADLARLNWDPPLVFYETKIRGSSEVLRPERIHS